MSLLKSDIMRREVERTYVKPGMSSYYRVCVSYLHDAAERSVISAYNEEAAGQPSGDHVPDKEDEQRACFNFEVFVRKRDAREEHLNTYCYPHDGHPGIGAMTLVVPWNEATSGNERDVIRGARW